METQKKEKRLLYKKRYKRDKKVSKGDYTVIMMGETNVQFRSYQVVGRRKSAQSLNWPLLLLSGHLQVR